MPGRFYSKLLLEHMEIIFHVSLLRLPPAEASFHLSLGVCASTAQVVMTFQLLSKEQSPGQDHLFLHLHR